MFCSEFFLKCLIAFYFTSVFIVKSTTLWSSQYRVQNNQLPRYGIVLNFDQTNMSGFMKMVLKNWTPNLNFNELLGLL